jgi:ATP-dependent Clp protease ATP-binding subunit ClpB
MKIVDKMLSLLDSRLKESYYSFKFTDALKQYILDSAYSPIYGARPIKRFIQNEVETKIATMIISGEVDTKSLYEVSYKDEEIVISKI